ncbi:MAG: D-2-hydroxyacid dehydrogenase [Chloroflexota bacterium]
MVEINVLLSGNFAQAQVAAIRAAHPALVVHGEAGGLAIQPPEGLDCSEITYPIFHPEIDLAPILARVEVIVASRLPADIARRAPRLRWVQALGAGVDHLMPAEALRQADFTVTNVKGVHAVPMAETVLSMLLGFAKGWPTLLEHKRAHHWQRFVPAELGGRTLGLVGLGKIGRQIARVCSQMGMRVLGLRRSGPGVVADVETVYGPAGLGELLRQSDYVVCCLPNTPETHHLLGEAQFRQMQPHACFVNVGRGQVVDETALARALREGWIAGAGLDVFETEPLPESSPLWELPNVLIMPHVGGDSDRFMERCTTVVVENLRRYAEARPLMNVVDPARGY